jgi:hypothetical protein
LISLKLDGQRMEEDVRIRLSAAREGAVCLSLPWWGTQLSLMTCQVAGGMIFSVFVESFGLIVYLSIKFDQFVIISALFGAY